MRLSIRLALTLCFAGCFGGMAHAQVVAQAASASPRDSIRQASLPASQSIVNARRDAAENLQIRVTVQYLMVDTDTRRAIYQGLDRESIVTNLQMPSAVERASLAEATSPATSLQQIQSPSRVTSCTLSEAEFADVLKTAMDAPNSEVNVAPKVILLDGNEVQMTDLVQRPFVMDFSREGATVTPRAHSLDEGTRMRLVATLTDPQAGLNQEIDLKCELSVMRLLDVKNDEIFGINDEPLAVQVPVQQINTAFASRQLSVGQALLIDPHVSQSRGVQSETGVPVLGKIPYLGRSFKNVSVGVIQHHMLLLLQPSVEPMAH